MSRAAFRQAIIGLGRVLVLAHLLVGLALGYWGVVRAPQLLRRGDNARWQAFERRIARGRILDRRGLVLAETVTDDAGAALRRYPHPSAAHVVGYQAWRYGAGASSSYGSAGAEGAYDVALRGDLGLGLRGMAAARVLHRPQAGHDLRLTLDAGLQDLAAAELAGREGAIVVLAVGDGAVLTMASEPSFDPAAMDVSPPDPDDPRAPLLNRATQGLYPPGSVFKAVTLAAALDEGQARLADPVSDGDRSEQLAGLDVACANNPPGVTTFSVEQAFGWSCNLTFARLGLALGPATWARHAAAFGILEAPPFPLPAAAGSLGTDEAPSGAELVGAAFGQGRLLVTPLHMALLAAAVAGDGSLPKPYLLADVPGVSWRRIADDQGTWRRAMRPSTAAELRRAMAWAAAEGWARPATDAAGLALGGKTGTAQLDGEQQPHAWFIGFAPEARPRVAVAVLVAHGGEGSTVAAPIGGRMLAAALRTLEVDAATP